jgi:hypothetical protein
MEVNGKSPKDLENGEKTKAKIEDTNDDDTKVKAIARRPRWRCGGMPTGTIS